MDHVSGIYQAQTNATGDRSSDVAVDDIEFGAVNLRLIACHGSLVLRDRRFLCRNLLFGYCVVRQQCLVAVQVDSRIGERCLVLKQLSLGLL